MAIRLGFLGPSLTISGTVIKHPGSLTETFVNEETSNFFALGTGVIPVGVPIYLAANGVDDGIAVQIPSTALTANANNQIFLGITAYQSAQFAPVDCVIRNLHYAARITLQTRSASTANFASYPALSVGAVLFPESVNNGFSLATIAGSVISYSPFVNAVQSWPSATTLSSNFTGTYSWYGTSTNQTITYTFSTNASALYAAGRVFMRAM